MATDLLAEYRVKARNTSTSSENKIHDDTVARRYGFGGGLVPGVTVYAYVTHPLVEAFGAEWLGRGTVSVKFVKPIFDGDDVVVTGRVAERTDQGITLNLTAATPTGGDCAVATATLPEGPGAPVDLAAYGTAPLPADRPEVTRERLAAIGVLGTPTERYDEACSTEYLAKVSDSLAVYRGAGALAHPAYFLQQANQSLSRNVLLGPWIHTGSVVRHLSPARVGETLAMRGRVRGLTAKKGRESVELDLLLVAEGARPVAQIYHSAIYRLPAPALA